MNYAYQALRCHWQRWLAAMLVLLGLVAVPVQAETAPTVSDPNYYALLKPSDLYYDLEGKNLKSGGADVPITLHKQAVRTGPTEWTVNVSATINNPKVEPPKMEVVMLVDLSSSMRTNATEHKHDATCDDLACDVHVHSENCYELICTKTNHEHTYIHGSSNDCYKNKKCNAHNSDAAHEAAGCHKYGNNWYALDCDGHTHSYDAGCYKLTYEHEGVASHTHGGLGCYHCEYYGFKDVVNPNNYGNNDNEYILNGYATRLAVAAVAAERLLGSLPANSTEITRLGFNAKESGLITDIQNYYDVHTNTGTYLWQAINQVLSGRYFSTDPGTKKILVILNDGGASDKSNQTIWNQINNFKETGTIFTVGFAEADSNLSKIAGGDGGKYMMAKNAEQLITTLDTISKEISAMIEDPMGNAVGFDKVGFQDNVHTNIGKVTYVGDTIYWNPSANDTSISQITYSYKVTLDAETGTNHLFHTVGTHSEVPLNNTTYFHYSVDDKTYDAEFPIPEAYYEITSLQTTWRTTDNIILAATNNTETVIAPTTACAPEKIVGCDFKNEDGSWYFTGFTQDYAIKDSFTDNGATYLYVRTEITINGGEPIVVQTAKALEELVKAYEPNAYQVVHLYEKNMPLKLTVSKIVSGNMGSRNSKFDFTVTLPDMAGQTVGCTLGNTPTTLTLDVQGKASFSLSHDQTLVMNNVHGNYQVEEAPYGSYVTTVSVNDGQAEQKNSVMGKLDASNTHVAYTNSLDATIPTGVFTSSASALAGLLLSVVMFTITRAGRRARDDE